MADPVRGAQSAIVEGFAEFRDKLPDMVLEILRADAWRGRRGGDGEPFATFRDFVEHRQWEGLGIGYNELCGWCAHRPDILAALDERAFVDALGPDTTAEEIIETLGAGQAQRLAESLRRVLRF